MPGVNAVGIHRWSLDLRHVRKSFLVAEGHFLTASTHLLGPLQLVQTDGGGDVREVVLVPRGHDLIVPTSAAGVASPGIVGQSMERHRTHALSQTAVFGDRHAPFAGRDGLVGIEGKATNGGGLLAAALPRMKRALSPCGWEGM